MADDDSWSLKEDYHFDLGADCRNIIYHSNLNVILFATSNAEVLVFDVNTGTVLHRSCLSGKSDKKLQGTYLSESVNKILYSDGRGIGVRSDYNGVLLLDTILQRPVFRTEDVVKLELLLSEAVLLLQCLQSTELPGVEHVQDVIDELSSKIVAAQNKQKKGAKAQKLRLHSWNTICLELPHTVLKLVCSGLVMELRKQKKNVPVLPIASAISERLNGLLPVLALEGESIDRELMFSEATRHETFSKWPHMNYKWALPDQMAQAGFYHEPNQTSHDRALCFTCNVCLVCWEPTDEPWSEHERHSPVCPFVRGEYTHNVPMLVILATAPAHVPGDAVDVLSTTNVAGLVASASHNGSVNIWNVKTQFKREIAFYLTPCDQEINNKDPMEFIVKKSHTVSALPHVAAESDNLQLTALALVGTKQAVLLEEPEGAAKSENVVSSNDLASDIRPCLVCGVTVSMTSSSQMRSLENVWASSTNLAPSSSLIRAMNSVNTATSNNSLDIMKVADTYNPLSSHYLVVCDFHHKTTPIETKNDENGAKEKKKDGAVTGTGTSASSNGNRTDNVYHEILASKFLLEDVIEDVDAQITVANKHFFPPPLQYTASSSNCMHGTVLYGTNIDIPVPLLPTVEFDSNFNPISGEQLASTSEPGAIAKKLVQTSSVKSANSEPVVVQSVRIDAPDSLRITHVAPTKDGKHLYVALCPKETTMDSNQMDVDEDSEFYTSKSYVYWDQNEAHCNGEIRNDRYSNALLLVYALDFSDKVVKISREPVWRQELSADQAPVEHIMIPLRNSKRKSDDEEENALEEEEEDEERGPRGLIALVCKDGIVRLLDLRNLRVVSIARPPTDKFVSAAYCNSLERLCISTSSGGLYFYSLNGEEESAAEKETDELSMVTETASGGDATPSTSKSSRLETDPIIANRPNLTNADLRTLYKLTRFERGSPPYIATVSPCWSEMMQAQRQRRHPQHLHQAEDNTRTWRLQNDVTTWDEHVFELSLPRYYTTQGAIEHVDVRFTLHMPCTEVPNIQVTLLNMSRIGPSKLTSVDDRIDFSIGADTKNENQSILDEYLQNHNCEILCGPINLQRCMDLSDQYGSVTLTSPKLFSTKVKTLLVHIKAITDPTKDTAGKSKNHDSKPPTTKKLRMDETGSLLPGAIIERFAANAKKMETHIVRSLTGCDWIYEVSITMRSLSLPSVPNERQQRIAMLHSASFIDNLISVACLKTDDKSPITQSLALDILIWVIAIRMTRLRPGKDNNITKAMQYETIHCIQKKLPELLRTCFLYGERSVAHKCVKIVLLCSEGLVDLDDSSHTFEDAVLNVLVSLMPSIVEIQWAGSLRWMFVLITRLLPLDVNHNVAQQCIPLVQKISNEMSNRVNPYRSLLATRFGLYTSPFETELFDMEPPVLPKFSSVPVNYASAVTGEHSTTSATSINCVYSQETFDLRDLLNLPSHSNNELVVPSKLKTLCANYNMRGLLEVEPLHFTCHSASDGTKMEKIDMGINSACVSAGIYDCTNNGPEQKSANNENQRENNLFPWTKLLCWPSHQALVVERMHSGARRFIVLDFGSPVLLTDFMIPCCSELVSLYIDIWNKSEEIDGIRLVVAGDIGSKPLVVNDLQPPPVCRYLKITTIGRYGLTATRCKIPLGVFYGHLGILPGEDYSEMNGSQSSLSNMSEASLQSSLDAQYNVLSALSEEIQCRMSLASEKLKQYLDPLLCAETPNVVHMQHFLQHQKTMSQNKELAPSKILTTYKECIMFQNQLNVIRGVWRRLQTWQGIRTTPNASLTEASTDKLRVLCETILDVLLYTVYEIGPVPSIPQSLFDSFTVATCEKLFHSICVVTPAPRLQLHAVALLARMAGHQPWWGKFLASTLVNLFSSFTTQIFPQDRVFILLTFLGRKSLVFGPNKSSVIESVVQILETLLSTLMYNESGSQDGLDITLIGWVLLFLSVCLDTTFTFPSVDDNHDKNKYQSGVLSRWEFIQGESAMQRKYVNANRSSNPRNLQRKLQKQLMRHKQQMQDLEQAKKVLSTPALWSATQPTHAASLSSKLEAALKTEERNMKKSLMNSAKHIKDFLLIRNNNMGHYMRNSRSQSTASTSKAETIDPIDYDVLRTLSHKNILPVAKGLIQLILSNVANVDMFLLACKVVARLVVSTRPAIGLSELMTDEQLLKLVKLATGESDSAWSSHAICCLLQDILEGGKLTSSRNFVNQECSTSDKGYQRSCSEDNKTLEEDVAVAGPSKVSTSLSSLVTIGNSDDMFPTGDDDTQDSIATSSQPNTSTSKSNGFTLPSLWESDDSELDDFLDEILEHGKNYVKRGNIVISKLPTSANLTTSLAMDARLEYGVEGGIEIILRKLSTIGLYNLPFCINATNHPGQQGTPSSSTLDSPRQAATSSRQNSIGSQNEETSHNSNLTSSNLSMLTRCFDELFTGLYIQNTNLEQVLQLWITLNMDVSPEVTSSNMVQFDSSVTPVLPLSAEAISGLINAYYWRSGVSLRAWCLALQCLTLASNQPLVVTRLENELGSRMPHMDSILGGMAGCIIRERNLRGVLLKLLSGSGLESDSSEKQHGLAGPTVCTALQDFLMRLQMRCDVVTVDSGLGIALKELLLWLVYQLVQPNGAIASRRGPLDAQCRLIGSLLNLNFVNTEIGTHMSISECVADLVYTHVRSSGVGARCNGAIDFSNQAGSFSGLFASVLGGDARQYRPASWEYLIVNLIKLVTNLVQTPLPFMQFSANNTDNQTRQNTSQTDESKAAEQTSSRNKKTWKPQVPCVGDTVLQHEPTMMRLLSALSLNSGSSLAMLLGDASSAGNNAELGDPHSIADATFELLTTLASKASSIDLVLYPIKRYLSSYGAAEEDNANQGVTQLSEPLLWYILRVLDNTKALSSFTTMGGMQIICDNLVKCSKSSKGRSGTIGSTGSGGNPTGVIAMIMQHLCNTPNVAPTPSSSSSRKETASSLEVLDDGLLNFAPLGNITWLNPTAQPADVLIQSTTPHRRARTPAWSYHFYPDEAWVDLTITLPSAILLKEVELQPHVPSLATCPSLVAIEISRETGAALTPVCPPMPTAGLTYIRINLSKPEVVTVVLIRLYKPRDSLDVNLSQIRLLGTTAFGDKYYDIFDEEQLTKSSLGWLRLLDQCLSVSTVDPRLCTKVLNSTASVEGLVEACINLLLLPAPFLFTQNLDRVLLHLGLHSREFGHNLITLLLNIRSNFHYQVSPSNQDTSIVQMIVELLQQLCSSRDANTESRVTAVLTWLQSIADSAYSFQVSMVSPHAIYIHCISTIIWKAHSEQNNLNYNLSNLITDDLFNSLYLWTLVEGTRTSLKQAIDSVLCAMCHVRPPLFEKLLKNLLDNEEDFFISDEFEDQPNDQPPVRNSPNFMHWYKEISRSGHKRLPIIGTQLLTLFAAARSSSGIKQLIDSQLPMVLIKCIIDFCETEKAKMLSGNVLPKKPSTFAITDNDKAGASSLRSASLDNCMSDPDGIATVLEAFTYVCSEGEMRDWLGKEGSLFWFELLSLLSSRPLESPSSPSSSYFRRISDYTNLECNMIKFLSACCWCHPANQKLLAIHLTDVLSKQNVPPNTLYFYGISGFTRRLILQLLLENEKVAVFVTSESYKVSNWNDSNLNYHVIPAHPAYPIGDHHQLLCLSTQLTVEDILQKLSDPWINLLFNSNYKANEASTSGSARIKDGWTEQSMSLADTLSVAAGNTAKSKRAKEAQFHRIQSQSRTSIINSMVRRIRRDDSVRMAQQSIGMSSTSSQAKSTNNQYLVHDAYPSTQLPSDLTIAQLLAIAEDNGISLSKPCLYLTLRDSSKDPKDASVSPSTSFDKSYRSVKSCLEVFSAHGGLTALARHLPRVYPEPSQPTTYPQKTVPTSPEQPDTEWVKIEANEEVYEDTGENCATSSPRMTPPTPHVPPHSLAAFGLFLRLPNYSEVLLRDRKRAQCLLRLALGVTDDGEGADILSSPIATALPTLPFLVLKQLLDDTPSNTDDGLLLRRTMIEIGAVNLLLDCLAIFTHQSEKDFPVNPMNLGEPKSGPSRGHENKQYYWAKGTGYGTGSTQQAWNVEQSLLRQRWEEEHVTILLHVFASYIGGTKGEEPHKELPSSFPDLLANSCLLPAVSSHLRNDSVMDMARHIPLFRVILELIRAMAMSNQLVSLLAPKADGYVGETSIVSLLTSMKLCVDTYTSKINKTRGNKSARAVKLTEGADEDEGLSMLIPDIQETTTIVQKATARLVNEGEKNAGPSAPQPEIPLKTREQRYLEVMKRLQFEMYDMIVENHDGGGFKFAISYHFESNMRAAGERSHPTRMKRLAQEATTLSTALPLSYSSSVFVRCDADRLDVMKVLITGPEGTPYANGCFEFDVYFPVEYPNIPMMINLETTGRRTVRFNPNLYNDGKVCLSVLNTWHGRPEEKWNAHTSSFLQVLVSIQSLILVAEPYFNEPGYERARGTPNGAQSSQDYNANVYQLTAKWAMLDQIRNPCPCFKEVIQTHFWLKRHEIIAQIKGWIKELESYESEGRSGRSCSLSNAALKRHFKMLREELNKLPTPEGLEDLAEPLASPGSPLEASALTPSTPPTCTAADNGALSAPGAASSSNHVLHDIDTDVEMEKMVSKVCE